MVTIKNVFITLITFVAVESSVEVDHARQLRGRSFKTGPPPNLPPHLIPKFNKLPPQAKDRVLEIFGETNIDPDVDGDYINIDETGGIYYEEPPEDATLSESISPAANRPDIFSGRSLQASGVPVYHSRPGALHTIYLDFDGHDFTGRAWGGGASIFAKPFDTDGNWASFSPSELNVIYQSWERVAEDMAPFDVDVTTEEPASFGPTVGHVLITDKVDKYGTTIHSCGCGGVAYVGIYGRTGLVNGKPVHEYYSPALVFNKGLIALAEAASHEFGHNAGLSHDGVVDGDAYYRGHGTGETKWSSIMGVGYYSSIVQWSKGEYPNANQKQDDLAILASKLGYLPDDHPGKTPLTINGSTGTAAGIIEKNTDTDVFTFEAMGKDIHILVNTENDPNDPNDPNEDNYGNLDAGFRLVNPDTGVTVVTVNTTDDRDAEWTGDLPHDTYEIIVYGTGNREGNLSVGYTNYGSLGHYTVTVTNLVTTTLSPSASPSSVPTLSTEPSARPSASPSTAPSAFPSARPSVSPSAAPSAFPSASPSEVPSASPTLSAFPSTRPSASPSEVPSVFPSASPSVSLSAVPSTFPSASPSKGPSNSPSYVPSHFPTSIPSATPSVSPTKKCGDGICSVDESCNTCIEDCPALQKFAVCGNGVCETADGEDCISCPQDCLGEQSGNPDNRFCCGDPQTGCDSSKCVNSVTSCIIESATTTVCPVPEICDDGFDNDGNGLIDCFDTESSCPTDPACTGGGSCEASGGLDGSCNQDPSRCCSGECHKNFNRCK